MNINNAQHEQNILELYKLLGSTKKVAYELNVPFLAVYEVLKKYKLSIKERQELPTSKSSLLGAQAEQEFQKLVPFAVEVNSIVHANPAFDFLIDDITIDVKASHILKSSDTAKFKKNPQWFFQLKRPWHTEYGADFYMLFALHAEELKDGYDTYIVPADIVTSKQVKINSEKRNHSRWADFRIEPSKVCAFFESMRTYAQPVRKFKEALA